MKSLNYMKGFIDSAYSHGGGFRSKMNNQEYAAGVQAARNDHNLGINIWPRVDKYLQLVVKEG